MSDDDNLVKEEEISEDDNVENQIKDEDPLVFKDETKKDEKETPMTRHRKRLHERKMKRLEAIEC